MRRRQGELGAAAPAARIGRGSSAYVWTFTLAGVRIGFDLVLLQAGGYRGYLSYADLGEPPLSTVEAFAPAAPPAPAAS